ncbi:MAG: MarR family transcriptional regulator [Clostridiales bacterium]|nr:MarR family transcriptional regulator [Clostridiales bacterium]
MRSEEAKKSLLYDYYGALLGERQREAYMYYYEDNLTLAEIAAELGVTRQAVHTALKRAEQALESCERELGLIAKHEAYEEALAETVRRIDVILRDKVRAAGIDEAAAKDLRRIKKIIKELDI